MHRDIQYRFGRLLTVTTRAWSTYLDQRVGPLGLTGPRWHLLVELSNLKAAPSQTELASLLNIESASLIKMLDALEKAGLVRRVPHQTDRRTKTIEITKAGRKVMDNISSIAKDVRKILLDGVTTEEIETCMKVFSVIAANLEKL
ncbi:MAG TPA: MarR family transcriptional regulator [Caulobacteraceae bacterium]|jgi:MarR family transcriptional regulator for hemolysin|nr:MarR family transcriptional regulator [Caulobacteraceae bacterium]